MKEIPTRRIMPIEQAIERDGVFTSSWSFLRNGYFREGTPQQGARALRNWAKDNGLTVMGLSMEALPADTVTIRPPKS